MRRAVAGLAALAALFAAGFALAQGLLTVSIDTVSIGPAGAAFGYSANETVDFFCSLTTAGEPCGTATATGSTSYAVAPGTYTFAVEARYRELKTATSASTVFTVAPPSVSITTATVTEPATVTRTVTAAATAAAGGSGTSLVTWIAVAVGFAAVAAAAAGFMTVRWRRRSAWQATATTERPPPRCVPPGRWCTSEVTLKPARRELAYLELAGQGPAARDLSGRSESTAAGTLNEAVAAYRRGGSADEVRLGVMPAAASLLDELRVRTTEGAEGAVAVAAHLEGGKATCTFTAYACVNGEWKERDRWEVESDAERDELVAQVRLPLDDRSLELLVAELAGFVAKVDVA